MKFEENDRYYFDAEAAERPVKFIEKYCCHYEDRYAGQPFLLLDWQKQLVRDVWGWKRKEDERRRFRQVYLEGGKGLGKSPLMAALGLYMMVGDKEQGPQIYSIACDYQQANVTFDNAKRMIAASPKLTSLLVCKQFVVESPRNNGIWRIISGTAESKHGLRPTFVLADEIHEWGNRKAYDALQSNFTKRSQPIFFAATNAGSRKEGLCWQLHEEADRVRKGISQDETLYPMIFAADKDDPIDDPATWHKAIPSLGHTITEDALRLEVIRAKENPALEARFRRLYLSQWIQGSDKWLNMAHWEACERKFSTARLIGKPLYIGLDLSQTDDLCAESRLWVDADRIYWRVKLWIPRASARKYEDQDGTPFTQWAADGHVTILDKETIDPELQAKFGARVVKASKEHRLQALMYDRWKANTAVSVAEKAGVACVPVEQTFKGLSAACKELERLLKARDIVIYPNPCLRWMAANAEVKRDENDNIRPVKEHAGDGYTGRRGAKIDGITSGVTALSRAMRHGLDPAQNQWDGPPVLFV